jgi:hypothetical protein
MLGSKKLTQSWMIALLCATVTGGALLVSSLRAADDDAPATPVTRPSGQTRIRPQGGGGEATNLEGAMKAMNTAFGTIKKQVSDPTKNDSSIVLLGTFEKNVVIAKGFVPPKVAAMAEADRKKALADFQGMLRSVLRDALDMEDQLAAGDNKKAADTADAIGELEKAGHSDFIQPGRD